MTKVAVLSDIHGNFDNLQRVAEATENMEIKIFLGDLLTGGDHPEACWNCLKRLNPDCWILGNTDEWLLDSYDRRHLNNECQQEAAAAEALLSRSVINALSSIRLQQHLKVGQCSIFCIHDESKCKLSAQLRVC